MAPDRDRRWRHPAVPNAFPVFLLLLLPPLARRVLGDLAAPDNASGIRRPGPMILPLALSYRKSSRSLGADGRMNHWRRRQLQRAGAREVAEARMRLYDDLLTNGYYTTRLYIGTPPQVFALIVDSGSTLTYVPCSTCEHCGNHQDPRFQPDLSSSYKPLKCGASVDCMCDRDRDQCVYERQYAEMSSSSGVLGEDVVSFGNESAVKPQTAVFGCENIETGDLFSQHADGIIGLGRGHLSIMDQLVGKGVIRDSFSLCYGGMNVGGGAMVLGDLPFPPEMVFSHSDPVRSPYYNVELREIHVAGEKLQLNPKIFDRKHGTILDSGTTYVYLPKTAFIAFRDAVMRQVKHLKQIHGPEPSYNDICFSGAGSDVSQLSESFPEVDLSFSNGQKFSLSPENYLFRHSKVSGAYCLGFFQNGKDPTTLLGGILVRNTLVTYDRENERIGFWKTNCTELWDRLHLLGTPSPASSEPLIPSIPPENSLPPKSSNSFDQNSTVRPPLAPLPVPPSEHQNQNLPGEFHVGLITFELYLSLNYSELEAHIQDLRDIIAQDVEVSASQVQVISSQSEGNGSLVRWAVFPSKSSEFLSNAAAMDIISHLTKHHVRLPENFGSYQLRKWKIEPLPKRSWLQKHRLPMALVVTAVVMLCFSTCLVWYLWVHRQGPGSYRPVNAAVPEHELQPL